MVHNRTMQSLDGVRVLDLSRVLAGPWCTQILADLGADVVKVERPGVGDDTRGWGPPFLQDAQGKDSAESAYFLGANRNKRSIALDLRTAAGKEVLRRMIREADVLVQNYRPGVMEKLGLGYELHLTSGLNVGLFTDMREHRRALAQDGCAR